MGPEFARTLRAAQAGDEESFVRLWRDANPLIVRYLRVLGHHDPYDGACEGWVTVVRGMTGFSGDEEDWRVWLLSCARMRAQESTLRRAWGSLRVAPGFGLGAGDALDPETLELDDLGLSEDPRNRGLADSLTALQGLPLGQGEVLLLRLLAGLTVRRTGLVVGLDDTAVRRLENRGLERLEVDRELLGWSLAAPATAAELVDERVVLSAFRTAPHGTRKPARVISIGPRAARAGTTAARSRTALVGIAAVSASVMSLGGLSAAAYVGALPDPVQQVAHDAFGAPAPGARGSGGDGTSTGRSTGRHGTKGGAGAATRAAADLCRSWAADRAKGVGSGRSAAFANLVVVAGGSSSVDPYCSAVLAGRPVPGATTGTSRAPGSTNSPNPHSTQSRTPNPHSTQRGTPNPNSTKTKTANPNSPTKTNTPNPNSTRTKTANPNSPTKTHTPNPNSTQVPGTGGGGGKGHG